MRKGQVTIFIIIGLVIVIAIGLLIWTKSDITLKVDEEDEIYVRLVESCIRTSLDTVLPIAQLQGGHLQNVPEPNLILMGLTIPVYQEEIQTTELLQNTGELITPLVEICIQNFSFEAINPELYTDLNIDSEVMGKDLRFTGNFRYDGKKMHFDTRKRIEFFELVTVANKIIPAYTSELFDIQDNYNVIIEITEFYDSKIYFIERNELFFTFAKGESS